MLIEPKFFLDKGRKMTYSETKGTGNYLNHKGEISDMEKLIDSSGSTLRWLSRIRLIINDKIPSLIYKEAKYWASLNNPETERNVVYFHPTSNQIRLFTKLDYNFDMVLQPSPSSKQWKGYPSIFTIKSEEDIEKAIELIISSYLEDKKTRKKKNKLPKIELHPI
jgi:hypothetical protein